MSELKLDVPPELLSILRELGEPSETVKECVVLELYRRGVISSGKVAELLGMTRWEFIRYAGRLGIPFLRMTAEEWEEEVRRIEDIVRPVGKL